MKIKRVSETIFFLPFFCEFSYNQRLEMLDSIPVCYWHEYLDMVFFFKCTHGITVINNELLPTIQNRVRATRSADPNSLIYKTKKCKTATYQKSFLTRSSYLRSRLTRLWNILPKDLGLTHKNTTFNTFKSGLLAYYKLVSKTVYDAVDPRTWKSICLCCNTSRNLSCPISCCS